MRIESIAFLFRPDRMRPDAIVGRYLLGRLFLALTGFVLAISPFTEHYWAFDRFLHGGQDLELSLTAFLTFLCLILLLAMLRTGSWPSPLSPMGRQAAGILRAKGGKARNVSQARAFYFACGQPADSRLPGLSAHRFGFQLQI